ncbi:MAG TPA: hypothetical protein VKP89_17140 [Burkholderiales bacterium]|nr:hypothetical protein [Burkholderiales bacterium]
MGHAIKKIVIAFAIPLLAGCASYDGRGLVPGRSTASDVTVLMGTPADRMPVRDGDTIWYYPRGPEGLQTYAIRIAPDGVMRSIEQVLTVANMRKIVPGVTTGRQAREILGPPWQVTRIDSIGRDDLEYRMYDEMRVEYNLYVRLSYDGIVREVLFLRDYSVEPSDRHR